MTAQEEEQLEELRLYNEEHTLRCQNIDPFTLEDSIFRRTFRLNKEMAQYVLNRILPVIDVIHNPVAVPVHLKFCAALTFYATESYQTLRGQSVKVFVAQQTISKSIAEVSEAVTHQLELIQFPQTAAAKNAIKASFMEHAGFPGVIGAIDGAHVAIISPSEEEYNYLNRKGYHSKNVQIIGNYNLDILNINARYPGATHDSFIWRNSLAKHHMEISYQNGNTNSWLLGDSGYPQEPWLMTLLPNAAPNTPEEHYNNFHIRARICVERCIGVLKGSFRCILGERTLHYTPQKASEIINVCSVLHNICVSGRLEIDFDLVVPDNLDVDQPRQDGANLEANACAVARRRIINEYFDN